MKIRLGSKQVTTPSGEEWSVGRRWISRRLPRLRRLRLDREVEPGLDSGWQLPGDIDLDLDLGLDELGVVIVLIVLAALLVLLAVPLLLFGIELIVIGLLIAAGIASRIVLGHPWVVTATPKSDDASVLIWEIKGWRNSGDLIEKVSTELASGATPLPDDPRTPDQA